MIGLFLMIQKTLKFLKESRGSFLKNYTQAKQNLIFFIKYTYPHNSPFMTSFCSLFKIKIKNNFFSNNNSIYEKCKI